jgi:transcriptional regulator with XRE-family HTH domain
LKGAIAVKIRLTLGEKLRDLRDEKKLTLSALSDEVNIPVATLQRMESDEDVRTGYQDVAVLAKFYEVSTDYLFGLTDNRQHRHVDVDALKLSDEAIEALKFGGINNRLVSELLAHPDFTKLMNSVEVYVDRKVLPQMVNINAMYKLAEDTIRESFQVGDDDEYIRQLQEAVVDEDEYLRYRISERFNILMKRLFELHKKDTLPKEQMSELREMKEQVAAFAKTQDAETAAKQKVALLCKQLGLNPSSLDDEELRVLVKVLMRSPKAKQGRWKR